MADHVRNTSPPITVVTTRRIAVATALLALSGAAASAAGANVAELPGAGDFHADAELIGLCAKFDAVERRHYQVFIAESRRGDEDAAEAAMDAMREEHEPLLEQITAFAPTTIEGAIALAATLQGWSHGDFADGDGTDDWLARTLIERLAKLSPSAHLLRFKFDNAGEA